MKGTKWHVTEFSNTSQPLVGSKK